MLTSFTTLLAVVALLLFAGEKLRGFSTIMIAGILIGTYSSLFIASPLVYLYKKFITKKGKEEQKNQAKKEEANNTKGKMVEESDTEVRQLNSTSTIVLSKKQQKKLESMKNSDQN